MSLRVFLIPEDPRNNGHLLEPALQAILADIGRPRAKIETWHRNPAPRGYAHTLTLLKDPATHRKYGHLPIWLFMPDEDPGQPCKIGELQHLQQMLANNHGQRFLFRMLRPCAEILGLAGCPNLPGSWQSLRQHPQLKQAVFEPYLQRHVTLTPGGGRRELAEAAARNVQRLYQLCPELKKLRDRLEEAIAALEGRTP